MGKLNSLIGNCGGGEVEENSDEDGDKEGDDLDWYPNSDMSLEVTDDDSDDDIDEEYVEASVLVLSLEMSCTH